MAVVVLGVIWPRVALVVVVMVVAVCIAKMPTTTVGCYGVVVSILGVACHGSGYGGSVTVLNRIQGRRGGPSSPDHPDSPIDACGVLPLLQSSEAGRLVLLMLGTAVTAASGWSLEPAGGEPAVGGKGERIWPAGV